MGGVSLDVSAGPLEIVAGLSASLDRLGAKIDHQAARDRAKEERARARVPSDVRQWAAGVVPAGGPLDCALNVGGPEAGFYWLVRRIAVGGVLWSATPAGEFELYVTALAGIQTNVAYTGAALNGLTLPDIVDASETLPFHNFYSNRQVIVQEQENLVFVLREVTSGLQYAAVAQVECHRTLALDEVSVG